MFSIIGDLFTLLFLQIFSSKEQKQDLSRALQHNNRQLREIHHGYLALGAQAEAFTVCAMRQADEAFARVFSGLNWETPRATATETQGCQSTYPNYWEVLNKSRAAVGLPPI
jgi:hypothetical protein